MLLNGFSKPFTISQKDKKMKILLIVIHGNKNVGTLADSLKRVPILIVLLPPAHHRVAKTFIK